VCRSNIACPPRERIAFTNAGCGRATIPGGVFAGERTEVIDRPGSARSSHSDGTPGRGGERFVPITASGLSLAGL